MQNNTAIEQVKIFKFSELAEKSQLKAIELNRDEEPYHEWYVHTQDLFIEVLEAIGFSNLKTYFTGFHSQGDGACFIGDYDYKKGFFKSVEKLISHLDAENQNAILVICKKIFDVQKRNGYLIDVTIKNRSNYMHSGTMQVHCEKVLSYSIDSISAKEEAELTTAFRSLADIYYKWLNEEYNYLLSDEASRNSLMSDDGYQMFNPDGTLYS